MWPFLLVLAPFIGMVFVYGLLSLIGNSPAALQTISMLLGN